jgi:hypothetical protein
MICCGQESKPLIPRIKPTGMNLMQEETIYV